MTDTATIISSLLKGRNILTLLQFLDLTGYLWPRPAVVKDGSSYDFVIVGGGTAGCIIASRLVKFNVSVLLIEAGSQPPLETMMSGLIAYSKESQFDWNFTTPYDHDAYKYRIDGVAKIQQGKILGGSGQVNYMIHGKGIPKDYDKWAAKTNDSSWRFKNLCKIFKKIEKVVDKRVLNSPNAKFHGTKGKIILKKYNDPKHAGIYQSYKELGQETVLDINPKTIFGYSNAYFNTYNRIRRSTAYSYLSPEKNNPNLSVIYNALATKVLFDKDENAIGVVIRTQNGDIVTVKANKEVIISAGVIKSPHLLMLSGVGPKDDLEKNKIKVISNLPEVGNNFQDHPCTILIYKMGKAAPSAPVNPNEFPVTAMEGYVALDKSQGCADYQILSGLINNPEFFAQACASIFSFKYGLCDSISKSCEGRQLHYVTHSLLYAESRGKVVLKNNDPEHDPIIETGCYSKQIDEANHAKYLEHYNQVLNTPYFKNVSAELVYPELKTCDKLQKGTIEYFKCYVKAMSSSLHMYFGTCALGDVVDSNLRVIGVKKLRVADASVIPSSVGSTIQATVMMIAEKLVALLKKDYNLSRS